MKTLIASVLLLGAGAGGYGIATDDAPGASCPWEGGRVEMECLDGGKCHVTCYDDAGSVVCEGVVECPAPCDTPCGASESCAR